jgi:hypothetical protein
MHAKKTKTYVFKDPDRYREGIQNQTHKHVIIIKKIFFLSLSLSLSLHPGVLTNICGGVGKKEEDDEEEEEENCLKSLPP